MRFFLLFFSIYMDGPPSDRILTGHAGPYNLGQICIDDTEGMEQN